MDESLSARLRAEGYAIKELVASANDPGGKMQALFDAFQVFTVPRVDVVVDETFYVPAPVSSSMSDEEWIKTLSQLVRKLPQLNRALHLQSLKPQERADVVASAVQGAQERERVQDTDRAPTEAAPTKAPTEAAHTEAPGRAPYAEITAIDGGFRPKSSRRVQLIGGLRNAFDALAACQRDDAALNAQLETYIVPLLTRVQQLHLDGTWHPAAELQRKIERGVHALRSFATEQRDATQRDFDDVRQRADFALQRTRTIAAAPQHLAREAVQDARQLSAKMVDQMKTQHDMILTVMRVIVAFAIGADAPPDLLQRAQEALDAFSAHARDAQQRCASLV